MRIDIRLTSALIAVLLAGQAHAAEYEVHQKGRAFSTATLQVRQGDSLKFVNDDPFAHNVFSLSEIKSFDLGSHGQGMSKSVVMDKAGTVDIECAVHPDMKLTVEVRK
jgi:plastocyanin